jgi:transglutaminase-like putative cysteine protease
MGDLSSVSQFLHASPYVPRVAGAEDYALPSFPRGRPALEGAFDLMRRVYTEFRYDPTATSVATPLSEVFRNRRGVCQDFSHAMIACLRAMGLPARYVSGYLETRPPPGKARLVGADASHAWVQVWCPLHGWVALDPTNAVLAGTDHVTLAWGRDYADVAPLRGVIRGGGRAHPHVAVTVEPLGSAMSRVERRG